MTFENTYQKSKKYTYPLTQQFQLLAIGPKAINQRTQRLSQ